MWRDLENCDRGWFWWVRSVSDETKQFDGYRVTHRVSLQWLGQFLERWRIQKGLSNTGQTWLALKISTWKRGQKKIITSFQPKFAYWRTSLSANDSVKLAVCWWEEFWYPSLILFQKKWPRSDRIWIHVRPFWHLLGLLLQKTLLPTLYTTRDIFRTPHLLHLLCDL